MNQDLRFHVVDILRSQVRGRNIADLAHEFGITISQNGKRNKGWVGQTLDRVAKTQALSGCCPDGPDFELKSVHVVSRNGEWVPKETMAITMFNFQRILDETFEASALWHKLSRLILVGHCSNDPSHTDAKVHFISPVDVTDPALRDSIEQYWHVVQAVTCKGRIADYSSKGTSTGFVQLRTKGSGSSTSRCPITGRVFKTRAFYATKRFIKYVRGNMF